MTTPHSPTTTERKGEPRLALKLELMDGFEPSTSPLPRVCSTPELHELETWSGQRGSNPHHQLGRLRFYH